MRKRQNSSSRSTATEQVVSEKRKGRAKRAAYAIVVAAVLYLALQWYWTPRFDSSKWKASTGRDAVRVQMVDDLLQRYELVGMTHEQIHQLLGPPRNTPYFREFDYVYLLGPERSFVGIDSEWLCINFAEGLVTEVRVMSD